MFFTSRMSSSTSENLSAIEWNTPMPLSLNSNFSYSKIVNKFASIRADCSQLASKTRISVFPLFLSLGECLDFGVGQVSVPSVH